MLDICVNFEDIELSNIQKCDLHYIEKWNESEEGFNFSQLNDRFLESVLSECEYFLKIVKNNKLIGIIKGRVEFKEMNEAWIWFYYLNEEENVGDLYCRIMEELLSFFLQEFDTKIFFTRVAVEDEISVNFWKSIGFRPLRLVKDFYNINDKSMDMLIMEKLGIDKKVKNIL